MPASLREPIRASSRAVQRLFLFLAAAVALPDAAGAAVYDVGPGKPLANVGDVPWESLVAGDVVQIHYRPTPYREKFVLAAVGTPAAPVTVRGILGPGGERPVLDGNGATTRSRLNYPSRARGVIKIGASNVPFADGASVMPQWLTIENLEIRGAHTPNSFRGPSGATESYPVNASAIFVEFGENILIRNCELHGNGNGLFAHSSDTRATRNLLVQSNYIHDNGAVGSIYEHNIYVSAIDVTYEYNRLGRLMAGAGGNNLKDRSAGLVVRYNWIDSANRQLDLVESGSSLVRSQPSYRQTFVYGNVLVEHPNSGNNDIVHYGGDSGTTSSYRKGTLYFYNNTVFSDRTDTTRLFRADTNDEAIDARNNLAYVTGAGGSLKVLDDAGRLTLTRNWFKTGWTAGGASGAIVNNGTVTGSTPGFVNQAGEDFHLAPGSSAIDAGTPLHPSVLPTKNVTREYVKHLSNVGRAVLGAFDIGAYERGAGGGDTSPPSAMLTTPADGATVSGTIVVSANASDNVGVAGVQFLVDGTSLGAEDTTAPYALSLDTTSLATGLHTLSARARDAAGKVGTSATRTVTVIRTTGTCVTAGTAAWVDTPFPAQTGSFTMRFDATPSAAPTDALVALSQGPGTTFTSYAVLVLFDPSRRIVARNGGAYSAQSTITYAAGRTYRFRLEVNVPAHTYSAYVTPPGGVEVPVGVNYSFRTEQATVSRLDNGGAYVAGGTGTVTVCNVPG
jgi:Bacterial Ig domain